MPMPVAIIKRRFTADDYQRMGETGILSEDDRVELIDGVNRLSCYSDPSGRTYRTVTHPDRGESVTPALLPKCPIPVDVVLTA